MNSTDTARRPSGKRPTTTVRRLIETGCNTTLRYIDIKLPRISIQQAAA
ncbi:MAG TPA: hypothetical protein VNS12_13365 [Pelagibacterium sp.]|nr:hypothetical protein [Pelagibacterium sp.]HWJ89051.1 hypothetical protein [Pelagibacterium sp.]